MRKHLRVCVEARDVYAWRALRQDEGQPADPCEDMKQAVIAAQAIVGVGVCDASDLAALRAGCSLGPVGFVLDGAVRDAVSLRLRQRFSGISTPATPQELSILDSVLPSVVNVLLEMLVANMAAALQRGFKRPKLSNDRQNARLGRLSERSQIAYLVSHSNHLVSSALEDVESRIVWLRKAARLLKRDGVASVDGRSDSVEEGDAA